jgi:ATP-binding cassette, subfamily G (WHITE), member 2
MSGALWVIAGLVSASSVRAQVTCENYGTPVNSSACTCPPGFGGATCSAPACGGNIFQADQRPLVSGASSSSFGNVSSSTCACPAGWTGTGCNVCQGSTVCQNAFSAAGGDSSNASQNGPNNTLTCNTLPRVFAAGEMSCAVIVRGPRYSETSHLNIEQNPTLQAVYPLSSDLTILRTLNTSLTPLLNSTSFGSSGSVYAQLWYDGVEQFYCTAGGCSQSLPKSNGAAWSCSSLQCTCRPGTSFCGGGSLNLTSTINGLNGQLTLSCDPLAANGTASCSFQQSVLQSVFGSSGLALTGCTFGECVRQAAIDSQDGTSGSNGGGNNSLSGGVIAGLAVVGAFIALALLGFLIGWWCRKKQRQLGAGYVAEGKGQHGGFAVEWSAVSYVVPQSYGSKGWLRTRESRSSEDDKVILDGISGRVEPGQLLGILGPSGASPSLYRK